MSTRIFFYKKHDFKKHQVLLTANSGNIEENKKLNP